MRPQHLKDLLRSPSIKDPLLSALASFVTLVMEGKTPLSIRPFFFGATLVALNKRDGGVRPIAVGSSLRRLVSKVAGDMVIDDMSKLLAPRQLGYGISGGAEAAVHATQLYLNNLESGQVLVKLDFQNAFNSIRRDKMLEATRRFYTPWSIQRIPLLPFTGETQSLIPQKGFSRVIL